MVQHFAFVSTRGYLNACARLAASAVVLSLILLAGCNAKYPSQPSVPAPSTLQVHYPTAMGAPLVGASFFFTAYIINSDGAYEDVTSRATWLSSNPVVVRMTSSPSGFTAVAPGLADLSASYQGLTSSVSVAVLEVDRQFPALAVTAGNPRVIGQTATTTASLRTSATQSQNVTSQAAWSSSDERVVTVTPAGQAASVKGVGVGTAQITAVFNGLSASYGLSIQP